MKNKIILLTTLLLASGSALAESSLMEAAGKKMVMDKATSAIPGVAEKAGSASEAVNSANTVKSVTEAAPATLTDSAQGAVESAATEQVKSAVPTEATTAVDTVKSGKAAVDAAPTSTGAAVDAVKGKAAGKALDMMK